LGKRTGGTFEAGAVGGVVVTIVSCESNTVASNVASELIPICLCFANPQYVDRFGKTRNYLRHQE
jgi:hypothetical protein